MVVLDILVHQAFQVTLIQDDYVVEQIPSTAADPALGDTVLPRTSEAGSLWLDAQRLDCLDYLSIEVRSSIKDQVFRSGIVGECFAQLLRYPSTGRMPCHIAMKDTPPIMCYDEEAVKHSKGERRYGKEVHRGNGFPMIAQKGRPLPSRLGVSRRSPHPAQHGSFRNVETKHRQLAVDPRSTPGLVFSNHAKDEFPQLNADTFSACANSMS
jgi:hypothetical protein